MKRIGVIGSLVWDIIYGRDPSQGPGAAPAAQIEEWGGVAYALGGFEAALPDDWELVPLIKVGSDLRDEAVRLLQSLRHLIPGGRCVEVTVPNNRVTLRYQSAERRCERMSGGVPGWTWNELGPMVRDLDALYVNFISGFELELGTARALRQGFAGPIYADLHSLFLGMPQDGVRMLRPLAEPVEWFRCFDVIQMNEEEMRQLSDDPLAVAAAALAAGAALLVVTLGRRGAIYLAALEFAALLDWRRPGLAARSPLHPTAPVRTALVPAPEVEVIDPTGCGDVFGAVLMSRLLAGLPVEQAMAEANRLAARNGQLRGAGELGRLLRGGLATSSLEGVA